jgi:putative membrane fusion protein
LAGATLLALGIIYQLSVNAHVAIGKISRNIEVVKYGCLEDKLVGKAIVINREEPVLAQTEGRFENMVKENEKVSKGALLGYFTDAQGKTPLQAQLSGIFVSHPDGLEEIFSAMSLQEVTPEIFAYKISPTTAEQPIETGQAIFKIVDSLQPTRLLMQFPLTKVDFEVQDQQSVKILLAGKDLGKAVVTGIKQDSENLFIELECSCFQEELLSQRYVELEVVFNSYSGYLIPDKAIVESEGKKGIYCSNGEDITFKPVKIIKTKDDIVVVEGLNKNDLLVNNPPN